MSLAGRPTTIARKRHADAVANARVKYRQAVEPIEREMQRIIDEALAPHRHDLAERIRAADIVYLEAIGRHQEADQLRTPEEREAA